MDKRQLKELIEKEKSKGTSVSLIRDKLVAKGYPKDIIDDVLDLKVPGFSVSKIKLLALWCGIFAIIIVMFLVFLNVPIAKVTPHDNITVVDSGCDNANPDICLFRKATENNDRTLCPRIQDQFLNGLCYGGMTTDDCSYYEFAKYPRSNMSNCYNKKAAEENNFTTCLFSGDIKVCLDAIFEKNGKDTVCDGRVACVAYLAEKTKDYSMCSNTDQCYISNAITFQNPEYCSKITDANTRKNCVSFFAKSSKDIKYCFYDTDAKNALDCIRKTHTIGDDVTSENTLKIASLVSQDCKENAADSNSDNCVMRYAFSFQMPFLCEKIQNITFRSDCLKFLDGSKEFPISYCETFKYQELQDRCVAIVTKCNSFSSDKRFSCFRSEID